MKSKDTKNKSDLTFRSGKNNFLLRVSWLQCGFIKRFNAMQQVLLSLFLLYSCTVKSCKSLVNKNIYTQVNNKLNKYRKK